MRHHYIIFILGLLLSFSSRAQVPQTISGIVQTEAGMPLPGATILLKGAYNGGSTNAEGLFQIKADFSKGPVILLVSFTGYETQELPLNAPDNAPDNALTVTFRPSAVLD